MKFFYAAAQNLVNNDNLPHGNDATAVDTVLTIVFGIIGGLALLMVAISGLRYILSGGEPSKVSEAKSALTNSIIGLVLAVLAFAIVRFIVGKF